MDGLFEKLKQNLVLEHDEDDRLLRHNLAAAVGYAESYQHTGTGYYAENVMNPTTEQAVIILATHFYESRDGATGGFFNNFVGAPNNIWVTVHRLLSMDKRWQV